LVSSLSTATLWMHLSTPKQLLLVHPLTANTLLLRPEENSTPFSTTNRTIDEFATPYFARIMNARNTMTVVGSIGAKWRCRRELVVMVHSGYYNDVGDVVCDC
jgi:hypothetical protein